VDSKAEHTA